MRSQSEVSEMLKFKLTCPFQGTKAKRKKKIIMVSYIKGCSLCVCTVECVGNHYYVHCDITN